MASGGVRGFLMGLLLGTPLAGGVAAALVGLQDARDAETWRPVPVLVAAHDFPAGHRLAATDLVESTLPHPLLTTSCADPSRAGVFVGQSLRWDVAAGLVLRDTDLIVPSLACAQRAAGVAKKLEEAPQLRLVLDAHDARHRSQP